MSLYLLFLYFKWIDDPFPSFNNFFIVFVIIGIIQFHPVIKLDFGFYTSEGWNIILTLAPINKLFTDQYNSVCFMGGVCMHII